MADTRYSTYPCSVRVWGTVDTTWGEIVLFIIEEPFWHALKKMWGRGTILLPNEVFKFILKLREKRILINYSETTKLSFVYCKIQNSFCWEVALLYIRTLKQRKKFKHGNLKLSQLMCHVGFIDPCSPI